ncbi:hypothetical protein SADUNF_Sadunf01G0035000 [Salix dunnii]|uniref:40S ribosomal protein S12 n=2 Tax=Magnoliopsida TaxID=3398 RepID=A0A835TJ05_9ROSI|nr:hypothetical protein SADUNF_Sadunf01G0035000 [Salix dunnii]
MDEADPERHVPQLLQCTSAQWSHIHYRAIDGMTSKLQDIAVFLDLPIDEQPTLGIKQFCCGFDFVMSLLLKGDSILIREVWNDNLEEEFARIREIVDGFPYIAMDTEFPGIVLRPHLMKFCNSLHGGLNKLAELLEVERVGISHQAGSDSLLTACTFRKLKENFFSGSLEKYAGVLYGLALQLVLKKSLAHGGLARGLHEGAKVIEKHAAQLCVLAEDCNQPDYIKLVKALCADHGVGLLTVPSAKTLGEWAGLCKIDSEGKARKVVGCSCVVVKDYGETSEGYNVVQEHLSTKQTLRGFNQYHVTLLFLSVKMPDSEIELQERLKEAGNGLINPPSSVDDLLDLLDKLERFLSNVDQAPPRSMQDALLPTMKALISSSLLRHSDEDVRFAVASCISEITRITAPDAPYNDDQMKEIFQLTVASFKKLSYASGHCYTKAISILENVARVRSCLVMLDLELDELIIEMFQHFLKFIRSNHPQNVILAMETIMTLVIDESEEISEELLTLLLASVKKLNQSISHIAQELGERVITNSAAKLKPYLKELVQSTGILLDEYAPIVASIFQDDTHTIEGDYSNHSGEHLGLSPNAACQGEVFEGKDVIPKSKASKGTASTRNAGTFKMDNASKMLEPCSLTEHSKTTDARDKAELEIRLEKEPKTVPSKRGWKPNSLMNPEEGYDPWFNTGRKITKLPREKHHDKGTHVLPSETPVSKKVALSLKHSSVTKPTRFTPKTSQISGSSSLPPQQRVSSGSHPKSSRQKKKGIGMNGDADPSPLSFSKGESLSAQVEEKAPKSDDTNLRKRSKETSDSEAKKQKHLRKVGLGSKTTKKISLSSGHVVSAKKSDLLCEPEEKPLHQSFVVAVRRFNKHGSSVPTGTKKRRLLDGTSDEDVTEALRDKKAKSLHRDGSYLEETPKTKLKRKCTPRKEVSSEIPDLAEQLVGSKIKVWWPKDKRFYEGVVDSYDPIKKKHRVLYADGDEEKLNLNRQRWELIKEDIFAVQEKEIDVPKTATSFGVLQKAKGETNADSLKRSKAVSSSKRAENISKTRARRSAYGAVPNSPTVVEKHVDHNTPGPDNGSEDGKNTPGPDSGSEDDGKNTSGPGSGSKDDGENSTVNLNINDPLTDINSKQAVLETVNPSDIGGPKAGTEYCSLNSEQTTSVGVTLSKDESSKGDDESQGSDGSNREQQGEVSSSFSPETE